MSEKKKSEDAPDLITRRGFVSHAAAAGGGGVLAHMMGGQTDALHAEAVNAESKATPASAPIPTRPFGNTGTRIPIVGFGAGSRFYGSTPTTRAGPSSSGPPSTGASPSWRRGRTTVPTASVRDASAWP